MNTKTIPMFAISRSQTELTLEEHEIYANDDGYQQHYVKADNYVSFHLTVSLL